MKSTSPVGGFHPLLPVPRFPLRHLVVADRVHTTTHGEAGDRSAQYLALLPRAHAHEVRALLLHLLVLLSCALAAAAAAASACSKARATKHHCSLATAKILDAFLPCASGSCARPRVGQLHRFLSILATSWMASKIPVAQAAQDARFLAKNASQTPSCHPVLTRLAIDLSRAQVGQFRRFFRVLPTSRAASLQLRAKRAKERPNPPCFRHTRTSDRPTESRYIHVVSVTSTVTVS